MSDINTGVRGLVEDRSDINLAEIGYALGQVNRQWTYQRLNGSRDWRVTEVLPLLAWLRSKKIRCGVVELIQRMEADIQGLSS